MVVRTPTTLVACEKTVLRESHLARKWATLMVTHLEVTLLRILRSLEAARPKAIRDQVIWVMGSRRGKLKSDIRCSRFWKLETPGHQRKR